VPNNLSVPDLYKLVFRALKGRQNTFQLVIANGNRPISMYTSTVGRLGIKDGEKVTIRIADDADLTNGSTTTAGQHEKVLVKVYQDNTRLIVAYWIDRYATGTFASILWKSWRRKLQTDHCYEPQDRQIWSDLFDSGDGMIRGNFHNDSSVCISTLLNNSSCFGHLGDEDAFRNDCMRRFNTSGPMVFKVDAGWAHVKKKRVILSRLGVLKQMFEALVNRLHAYASKLTWV
jgi:hypothetical protein